MVCLLVNLLEFLLSDPIACYSHWIWNRGLRSTPTPYLLLPCAQQPPAAHCLLHQTTTLRLTSAVPGVDATRPTSTAPLSSILLFRCSSPSLSSLQPFTPASTAALPVSGGSRRQIRHHRLDHPHAESLSSVLARRQRRPLPCHPEASSKLLCPSDPGTPKP
jgi:hypothetical protein